MVVVAGDVSLLNPVSSLSFRTVLAVLDDRHLPSGNRARRGPSCNCRCGHHSESVVVLHSVPTTYRPVRRGANLRKEGMGNVIRREGEPTNQHTCAQTSANGKQPHNSSSVLKRT